MDRIRRKLVFGSLAAGAAELLGTSIAEANKGRFNFEPPSSDLPSIEEQRMRAAGQVVDSFWSSEQVRAHVLTSFFKNEGERPLRKEEVQRLLATESQMYYPTAEEIAHITGSPEASKSLTLLTSVIPRSRFGIFLYGDTQRMYLIKNVDGSRMQFLRAYPVSTSREEWDRSEDSGGTPLGIHKVSDSRKAMLGEVVSASNKHADEFTQITEQDRNKEVTRTFVRSLTSGVDPVAEVVTGAFHLTGKHTSAERGIFIHGTNRTNNLGVPGSGGCIRASNVDIYDLFYYVENETPVMIFSSLTTEQISAQTRTRDGRQPGRVPPPWQPAGSDVVPNWGPKPRKR